MTREQRRTTRSLGRRGFPLSTYQRPRSGLHVPVPDPDDPEAVADYLDGLRRDREVAEKLQETQERVLQAVADDLSRREQEEVARQIGERVGRGNHDLR